MIALGILSPILCAFSQYLFRLFGFRSWSATVYRPYMSLATDDQPPVVMGLGFVIVLIFANMLAMRGYKAFCEGRKKALSILATGLLLPVMLEIASLFRSVVLAGGLSGMPRRYHYYYAPEPNPVLERVWDSFVPSSYWLVIGHAISLVLLVLGNAILCDESRQVEN